MLQLWTSFSLDSQKESDRKSPVNTQQSPAFFTTRQCLKKTKTKKVHFRLKLCLLEPIFFQITILCLQRGAQKEQSNRTKRKIHDPRKKEDRNNWWEGSKSLLCFIYESILSNYGCPWNSRRRRKTYFWVSCFSEKHVIPYRISFFRVIAFIFKLPESKTKDKNEGRSSFGSFFSIFQHFSTTNPRIILSLCSKGIKGYVNHFSFLMFFSPSLSHSRNRKKEKSTKTEVELRKFFLFFSFFIFVVKHWTRG